MKTNVVRAGPWRRVRSLAVVGMLALLSVGCPRAVRSDEAAPLAPAASADCGKTTGYDVIIVGAGMSGLTAEKELRRGRPDINVLILEATDHVGGRARTLKRGPPMDLGGAWLHGVATNQLTGIVDTMGFKRVTTRLQEPFFTERGRADDTTAHELWALNESYEMLLRQSTRNQMALEDCHTLFPELAPAFIGPKSMHWETLVQMRQLCEYLSAPRESDNAGVYLPPADASDFRALIAANTGPLDSASEIKQTSTVDAAEFEGDDDAILEKGMGTFVEAYGRGASVCFNSPVTRISYRDEGVVVEVAGGRRFVGRKVLVTVSTGVLKANKIKFDPQLPQEKLEAIEQLPMGYMQKVIIDFKDQEGLLPERDANSWVLYIDSRQSVMAFVIRPLNKNIAIGFYGGEQARRFEEQCQEAAGNTSLPPERQPCDEQAVKKAQEALGKMYSHAVEQAVEKSDIYVTRWSLEPWTLGAYSAAVPNAYVPKSARERLAEPVAYGDGGSSHQVFFAGEACSSPMYNGSLAGAYESGVRAARLMLAELPPRAP